MTSNPFTAPQAPGLGVAGATDAPVAQERGHPRGLYLLFTVEMWERMSYYGMRALLVLYMTAATTGANPGFGFAKTSAYSIYGWYTGLVYMTPFFGGIIADRVLGQRRAVFIGGLLMMVGHFLMAVPGLTAFYAALGFLILGNGFFKPNISTMVGGLYKQGDARRDGAFTIFYMGINLGAFLSPLVCGTLGEKVGFHYGFGSAGVGMLIGVLTFWWGNKRFLGDVGLSPKAKTAGAAAAPKERLTKEEIDRLTVIIVLSIFTIVFWAAFEQAGGLMNVYTNEKVDRLLFGWEIPTTWFQAVNPALIFIFAPIFSMIWFRLGTRKKDPPTPVKMAIGLLLLCVGFVFMLGAVKEAQSGGSAGKANMLWVIGAYFWHTMGELCLSPIGLSMVTKLSPVRMVSMMMGTWFISNFIANKAAGSIGELSESVGEFNTFLYIVIVTGIAAVILYFLARPLVARMHGR